VIALILALMAAEPAVSATPAHEKHGPAKPAPAKPAPAKPAPQRTGPASALIHSEAFKHGYANQAFRVDYTASLTWTLADAKSCFVMRCHPVCNITITHKILSRQLWRLPDGAKPVLAENDPGEREYAGGVVTLGRACKAVSDADVTRVAAERLRPYQFAEELIHDRPMLFKAADDWLALHEPPPPPPAAAGAPSTR
jgi:hypothetical protein